jgi:hypothetical protein
MGITIITLAHPASFAFLFSAGASAWWSYQQLLTVTGSNLDWQH